MRVACAGARRERDGGVASTADVCSERPLRVRNASHGHTENESRRLLQVAKWGLSERAPLTRSSECR